MLGSVSCAPGAVRAEGVSEGDGVDLLIAYAGPDDEGKITLADDPSGGRSGEGVGEVASLLDLLECDGSSLVLNTAAVAVAVGLVRGPAGAELTRSPAP